MASLGHIAVGMAAGRWWSGRAPTSAWRPMAGFSLLSMLPDIDVVGRSLGVSYGAPWGHRGATHSLLMAAVVGLASAAIARNRSKPWAPQAAFSALVVASHGLLDAMTDGGKGVALLWPLTTARFFLPWRPIPVAPMGTRFLSGRGLEVAAWEALAFLPLFLFALWPRPQRA